MESPDKVIKSSWLGSTPRSTEVPVIPDAPIMEDPHVELLNKLADGVPYDIVLLDSDHIGLLVSGELRVTYRKESIYREGSGVARAIMAVTEREARRAREVVRGFGRAARGSGAFSTSVESKPTNGVIPEVEPAGIERFIGEISDATAAERASMRDRRPHRDLLEMVPEVRTREVVEGNE